MGEWRGRYGGHARRRIWNRGNGRVGIRGRAERALVLRAPVVTLLAVVALTGVLGAFATQAEVLQGNEGFSPENRELRALETANERFGDRESIVPVIVEGEDVLPDLTVTADADVTSLYEEAREAAPELFEPVLSDGAGLTARLVVQTTAGEDRADELADALGDDFAALSASGVDVVATSDTIVTAVVVEEIQESQVTSLVVTLAAAMLLLVVTFGVTVRRPMLGVITIAPVGLVLLWTFGMMAATGIPFGPVTATISALAIGIGVPFTIHMTRRFLDDRQRHDDPREAIRSTTRHTGGALAGSALTTMAGFGVLATSSLTPFRQLGLVTAYAIGFALVAAVLVLPSMLTLWDRWHRRRSPRSPRPPRRSRCRSSSGHGPGSGPGRPPHRGSVRTSISVSRPAAFRTFPCGFLAAS